MTLQSRYRRSNVAHKQLVRTSLKILFFTFKFQELLLRMSQGKEEYLTIIRRRRSEYLVNKPLPAAGISADNVRG